jgi:hypothetical protein
LNSLFEKQTHLANMANIAAKSKLPHLGTAARAMMKGGLCCGGLHGD